MKQLCLSVLLILVMGCAELPYPVATFYLNRDGQLLPALFEYTEDLANKNNMVILRNTDYDINEELVTVFVADGNDWLNRSLSIGDTTHPRITLRLHFTNISVMIHAPLGVQDAKRSADRIIEDWKIYLDNEGIQFRLEQGVKWSKEVSKFQN